MANGLYGGGDGSLSSPYIIEDEEDLIVYLGGVFGKDTYSVINNDIDCYNKVELAGGNAKDIDIGTYRVSLHKNIENDYIIYNGDKGLNLLKIHGDKERGVFEFITDLNNISNIELYNIVELALSTNSITGATYDVAVWFNSINISIKMIGDLDISTGYYNSRNIKIARFFEEEDNIIGYPRYIFNGCNIDIKADVNIRCGARLLYTYSNISVKGFRSYNVDECIINIGGNIYFDNDFKTRITIDSVSLNNGRSLIDNSICENVIIFDNLYIYSFYNYTDNEDDVSIGVNSNVQSNVYSNGNINIKVARKSGNRSNVTMSESSYLGGKTLGTSGYSNHYVNMNKDYEDLTNIVFSISRDQIKNIDRMTIDMISAESYILENDSSGSWYDSLKMLNKGTYSWFDFNKVWGIDRGINYGYPYFYWHAISNVVDVTGILKVKSIDEIIEIPLYDLSEISGKYMVVSLGNGVKKAVKLVEVGDSKASDVKLMTDRGIMCLSR